MRMIILARPCSSNARNFLQKRGTALELLAEEFELDSMVNARVAIFIKRNDHRRMDLS